MTVVVGPDDASNPDVRALLQSHLAFSEEVTPVGHVHALAVGSLAGPGMTLVAARDAGGLLGVGALRRLEPGHAEIKSMHTVPGARGRGVGEAIVAHLLELAASEGHGRVSLETGTMDAFAPARRLYARMGFEPCPPFGSYTVNPYSMCMTRLLTLPGE